MLLRSPLRSRSAAAETIQLPKAAFGHERKVGRKAVLR
jgi:hypothetical protein